MNCFIVMTDKAMRHNRCGGVQPRGPPEAAGHTSEKASSALSPTPWVGAQRLSTRTTPTPSPTRPARQNQESSHVNLGEPR